MIDWIKYNYDKYLHFIFSSIQKNNNIKKVLHIKYGNLFYNLINSFFNSFFNDEINDIFISSQNK